MHDEIGVKNCEESAYLTGQCKLAFKDKVSRELIERYAAEVGTTYEFGEDYNRGKAVYEESGDIEIASPKFLSIRITDTLNPSVKFPSNVKRLLPTRPTVKPVPSSARRSSRLSSQTPALISSKRHIDVLDIAVREPKRKR